MFFALGSLTHTHMLTALGSVGLLLWWHCCPSRALPAPAELPRLFPPLSRSVPLPVPLSGTTAGPFQPQRGMTANGMGQLGHRAVPALLCCWDSSGQAGCFTFQSWGHSAGQMFHDSFCISSPVKPRQPKRRNLFFPLFFFLFFNE